MRTKNFPALYTAGLLLVLSIIVLFGLFDPAYPIGYFLLGVSTAIAVPSLIIICSSNSVRPIAFLVSIYLIFFFYIPGLFHLESGIFPWTWGFYTAEQVNESAFVVLIFTLLFYGSLLAVNDTDASTFNREHKDSLLYDRVPVFIIAALGLALVGCIFIGFDVLQTRRSELERSIDMTSLNVFVLTLSRILSFLAALLAVVLMVRRPNFITAILFILTIPVFILANSPLALPRFLTGAYLICFILVFVRLRPVHKFLSIVAIFVAQITIFPYLSYISRGSRNSEYSVDPLSYYISSADFDGFQAVVNVVAMVQDQGLMWGRQLASAVLVFVPREMIPWKSRSTGTDAAEHQGFPYTNLSAPMPAELFVDFGYVGLVVLTILLGRSVGLLDRFYETRRWAGDVVGFLPIAVLASYSLIVFRGALVGVIAPVGFAFLISYLATLFIAKPVGAARRKALHGTLSE